MARADGADQRGLRGTLGLALQTRQCDHCGTPWDQLTLAGRLTRTFFALPVEHRLQLVVLRADPTEKLEALDAVVPPGLTRGQCRVLDELIASLRGASIRGGLVAEDAAIFGASYATLHIFLNATDEQVCSALHTCSAATGTPTMNDAQLFAFLAHQDATTLLDLLREAYAAMSTPQRRAVFGESARAAH